MSGPSKFTSDILEDIRAERFRQDEKWGVQDHGSLLWNAILGEEVGEVSKCLLEISWAKTPEEAQRLFDHLKEELVQVAAVAVAWHESLDRYEERGDDFNG